MGCHHADAVRRIDPETAVLGGFVDPDESVVTAAAGDRDVPGFVDLSEALSEASPDVVHVCAPPALHGSIAMRSLEAGAHLYVEKPFTLRVSEAEAVLTRASELGRKVAAGHQLLMDPASIAGETFLDSIGDLRHIESYFAFKTRREVSGKRGRTSVEQLLDILPHPTYVLAHFMEASTGEAPHIRYLDAGEDGHANVTVQAGRATGNLVVTLEGRPVNSFVRLIGTRGTVELDYVRGIAIPKLWIGSGLDKVTEPYHHALALAWGSTASLARRLVRRERSYPGLRQMFEALYESIRRDLPSPVTPNNILFSVALVERVEEKIRESSPEYAAPAAAATVAVTGGSGFLGRHVLRRLIELGEVPLVLGRRIPNAVDRFAGAHYEACDLAEPGSIELPGSVRSVVHCAAETAGSWDAHQRNSIDATRYLLEAAQRAGVDRFLHVSSLGVLSLKARPPISEDDAVEPDPRGRGPYVWGKLESERLVAEARAAGSMKTYILRPGPLMDPQEGPPPGRLGRAAGPAFIAIGPRGGKVPTTDVAMAGTLLAEAAAGRVEPPELLHLLDPVALSRKELIAQERARRPGIWVFWMPWLLVRFLSGTAWALQKVLRPSKPAVKVSSAFAAPRYDTSKIAALVNGSRPQE